MLRDEHGRGITFKKYAALLEVGEYLTRLDFAAHFGVSLSCATYHIERAVSAGMVEKAYGYISNQPGYLYFLRETENGEG